MTEVWKPIAGYGDRYEISDQGRVRAVPYLQPYNHWRTGERHFRRTKMKMKATPIINSGYQVVWLSHEYEVRPQLVHRLVAEAFVPSGSGFVVNHKNGVKTDNRASNLEWVTDADNKNHAVDLGLNTQAIAVKHPATGRTYPSMTRAAREAGVCHRTVRNTFERVLRDA